MESHVPTAAKKKKTRPATPRQSQILIFIRDYRREHGYSPTLQEIGDHLSISKVTVFEHLSVLEERGFVYRDRHKARSLELADHLELPDERPTLVPLVGRIAAGSPIEAIQNPETLDLEKLFAKKGNFVLQVQGESMIDDHIRDGDFVVCEKRKTIRDGDTVVALLEDGEATLKRIYKEGKGFRLQPANSNFKPIRTDKVDVQGVVVGVVRRV